MLGKFVVVDGMVTILAARWRLEEALLGKPAVAHDGRKAGS
jgi:hypothetical protein